MENKKNYTVPIIVMIFLFGMISFVTNLAAPIGNIWKMQPGIDGSNTLGMMGNMMNFLAYAIMGIPAGKLLTKIGYKKTALIAIAVGLLGVFVQFCSGLMPIEKAELTVNEYGESVPVRDRGRRGQRDDRRDAADGPVRF